MENTVKIFACRECAQGCFVQVEGVAGDIINTPKECIYREFQAKWGPVVDVAAKGGKS